MGEKVEELLEAVTDMALHGQEAQNMPDKAPGGQKAQDMPDKAPSGQKAQDMPDKVPGGQKAQNMLDRAGRTETDFSQYAPLALAYIGDAVYDLIIRDRVVREGSRQVNKLHRETIHYVNAGAQSKLVQELLPRLTEQEMRIYKRGRNAVSHTVPKNQDVGDYRRATGFEALIGWLFLCGNYARIMELLGLEAQAEPSDVRSSVKNDPRGLESDEEACRMIRAMQMLSGADGKDAAFRSR